jgi:protein phosphatase PTC2/3
MGQTLSEPVTTKVSDSGSDDRLYYGVSGMQGWRVSMEDAHSAVLDIAPGSGKHISWFAVFDGHGGTCPPSSTLTPSIRFLTGGCR